MIAAAGATVILAVAFGANNALGAPNYVVVDLTPSGFYAAFGSGTSGTQQVGHGGGPSTGSNHALLWSGSPQSYVDLHPTGLLVGSFPITASYAYAASGTQQVGEGYISQGDGPNNCALLWIGTAASCVNLNPSGFAGSGAYGTNGTQQVGWGSLRPLVPPPTGGPNPHAILWNGSASSYVDLNPPDFAESYATGISGTQQVGYGKGYFTNSRYHALLWSGTPGSYVDLHPSGFTDSYAQGTSGTQQVGHGDSGLYYYALVWTGTAASCVNINPSGFWYSQALATNGIQQVGFGISPDTLGNHHALLWDGTAESYVDLHQFLPSRFKVSEALAIDSYGNILGSADGHAILWVVPEPASLSLLALGGLAIIGRRRK